MSRRSRDEVIAAAAEPPEAADQFEATMVWMGADELIPGRGYWLKLATRTVTATVHPPKYQVNVNSLEHLAAQTFELNAIGVAEIATDRDVVFEPYAVDGGPPNRALGGFILVDKLTNATVACGMLHFALRRARGALEASTAPRANAKLNGEAAVLGSPASARRKVDHRQYGRKKLVAQGKNTFCSRRNVRPGSQDLGFTEPSDLQYSRVARSQADGDAGLIVLTAFI